MEKNEESQPLKDDARVDQSGSPVDSDAEADPKAADKAQNDELAEAQSAAKEWENKYLYLSAEFENFRKRIHREKADFLKYGHEDFLREQLLVMDNFERAIAAAKSGASDKQDAFGQMLVGIEMILQQFMETLKHQGVKKIEAVGQAFDPRFHEAVEVEETDEVEPNTILREHLKGYMLHERVLRASKVTTAKAAKKES